MSIILAVVTVGIAFWSPLASLLVYLVSVASFVTARLFERGEDVIEGAEDSPEAAPPRRKPR